MNLYLLSQDKNNDYDTYDSAVVAAESEDDARKIHPSEYRQDWDGSENYGGYPVNDWTASANVAVKLIGVAAEGIERGVVCSSFNAG